MSRRLLALIAAFPPPRAKPVVYERLLGWSVHPSAHIGLCFVSVDHLVIEENVRISHFNVIKGCELVQLKAGVRIGAFNWISAPPRGPTTFVHSPDRRSRFRMGEQSALTMRHVIDCSDDVCIGDYSVLAGMRSQVMTHSVDIQRGIQVTAPVDIGHHSLIFSGSKLLAGARVPSRSVVAAGAVVTDTLNDECTLYGGVPAKAIKALPADAEFFVRTEGTVS